MQYITFPWEQVGRWLRSLSLSGSTGNTAAWIFYLCAGALPLALMLFLRTRQQAEKCDWLLLLLSAALYTGLWFFANPSYMDVYLTPIPTGGLAKYTLALSQDHIANLTNRTVVELKLDAGGQQ